MCVCVHHVHGMSNTVCVPLSFLHWCMCTAEIRKRTDPARASSFSSQAAQQQERVIEPNECVGGSVGGFCVSVLVYRCLWNVGESQDVPTLSTSSFPPLPSFPSCSEEVRVVQTSQSKLYSWWSNLRENNPITNCKGATVIEECVDCVGGHSYRVECRVCMCVCVCACARVCVYVCVCVHYSVVVTHLYIQ